MAKTAKSQDAAPEAPQDLPETYEAALAELEQLVGRMEGGELGLEESLGAYRRGAVLVKYCQGLLEKVEQQVKVLEGETLKPLEASSRDEF
ncbi:exodeoxyribonuclease VII small subunit [Pandoraea sputorum]|uniref:Exodeoxyribonuclease 7 small subunit n=1 Tax=Pandoraea sputorum TaxID=93222 RepID=A0A239SDY2_9BURK|nr:exodeoxyribonuclease VII small subunit [Pandoraea sputorum]AJC16595.1 exodeoxyribonuclease VII small subunit [Pandoraea sputorum]SNU83630.1 Exodeoxyribonuclease 7 small subunit [Pandoraea sputorum]VVD96650.1 exodeoxyribonuclease VII small subunit [Pandoraea sputorum]VVE77299.1 exodeoxyribonuclease VII small subunit [Pandoraea sputorum]VVE84712.1 exodeoxyribonuclease VII small subunit [Pandoraea sputorum]